MAKARGLSGRCGEGGGPGAGSGQVWAPALAEAPAEAQESCASLAAEDGALLAKIEKVRVLRNGRREGKAAARDAGAREPCGRPVLAHSLPGASPGARARPESWQLSVRQGGMPHDAVLSALRESASLSLSHPEKPLVPRVLAFGRDTDLATRRLMTPSAVGMLAAAAAAAGVHPGPGRGLPPAGGPPLLAQGPRVLCHG